MNKITSVLGSTIYLYIRTLNAVIGEAHISLLATPYEYQHVEADTRFDPDATVTVSFDGTIRLSPIT